MRDENGLTMGLGMGQGGPPGGEGIFKGCVENGEALARTRRGGGGEQSLLGGGKV